jgi:carboxypeptidase family protein
MRVVLIASAVVLLSGCGPHPVTVGTTNGTVAGHVLAWPCAPVERAGSPCPGRPAAHIEVDLVAQPSGVTTRVSTDAAGAYSVEVPAGTYSVSLAGLRRLLHGPTTVAVRAGAVTTADFVFDSGIR